MAEDGTIQEKGTERCCWKDRQFWLRVLVLLVLGYVFCSYFNDTFFDGDYKIMPVRQVYMVVLGTLFLYFCAKARYIGICVYTLACLLFLFLRYAKAAYGCELSEALVRAVIETNPEETAGFVSVESVTAVLISIVVCGALYTGARWAVRSWERRNKGGDSGLPSWKSALGLNLAALLAFFAVYALPQLAFRYHLVSVKHCLPSVFLAQLRQPFQWVPTAAYEVAYYYRDIVLDDSAGYASESEAPQTPLTVVLVVGESVRADHTPAGGYGRNTMPRLSAIPGITFFSRMYSFGTATSISFEGILSGLTKRQEHASRTSFLSLLKKEGFTNRAIFENTEDMFTLKLFKALAGDDSMEHKAICSNVRDVAASILQDVAQCQAKRQMVLVENGTGHFPYHYEDEFGIFQPADMDNQPSFEEKIAACTNRYDNSILATDTFLAELLDGLKDRNAVVLYCSDHGESLGEGGHLGHAADLDGGESIRHVAAFIWFSDKYRESHPDVVADMEAARDKVLVHGQIYATILTLCGVKSEVPLNIGDFAKGDILKQENNIGHLVK